MTIGRGSAWGESVVVPPGTPQASTDGELARYASSGTACIVAGGDLWRTLGAKKPSGSSTTRVGLDVIEIAIGDGLETAVSHVVVRLPWWRGGLLRGPATLVMNVQYLGRRDMAPRGHPNDGRFEVVSIASDMNFRQRCAAWRRSRTGTHVPHPKIAISTHSETSLPVSKSVLVIDGVRRGKVDATINFRCRPDAVSVYFYS